MNDRVLTTIRKYKMIEQGDKLLVAVSGGADSVALLHFLRALAPEWELRVTAAHLNHRLRGDESGRDEAFVRELCARLGVELAVRSEPVARWAEERGLSIEQAARERRYAFLEEEAGPCGAKIATAHTRSDSAETVLLNLARGTALRGLCGIPPVRGNIIRPLIGCTRAAIEAYCAREGLEYVTDSTNAEERYTRNRLRHKVLPLLEEIDPAFQSKVGEMTELLRADADYLDGLAEKALAEISLGRGGTGAIGRAAYLKLPAPISSRVLRLLLQRGGIPWDNRRLGLLHERAEAGSGAVQLGEGIFFVAGPDSLRVERREAAQEYFSMEIALDASREAWVLCPFPGKTVRLRRESLINSKKSVKNHINQFKNALDYDKIEKIVWLRQRSPGDCIRLAGRGCTKPLKKLFNQAAIPPLSRSRILVLADDEGVLWVEGFGAGERAAAGPQSGCILVIEVEQNEYDG